MYVQSGIYDKVVEALVARGKASAIGKVSEPLDAVTVSRARTDVPMPLQPSDEATSFGPLISEAQRDKVLGYIEDAKQNGATIATGGGKWDQSEGFYITPTVITDVKQDMKCVQEEVSHSEGFLPQADRRPRRSLAPSSSSPSSRPKRKPSNSPTTPRTALPCRVHQRR